MKRGQRMSFQDELAEARATKPNPSKNSNGCPERVVVAEGCYEHDSGLMVVSEGKWRGSHVIDLPQSFNGQRVRVVVEVIP